MNRSKYKFQCELNQTGVIGLRGYLSKAVCRFVDYARGWICRRVKILTGKAKLRVIEEIEELGPELKPGPLPEGRSLEHGEIKALHCEGLHPRAIPSRTPSLAELRSSPQ